MKKASTYYFAILMVLNGVVACLLPYLNGVMTCHYATLLGGKRLPPLTALVVTWPCWPHVFCFLFLVGCAISICTKMRSATLCHALIVGLSIELLTVFTVMLGYALPFISITVTM